VNFSAKVVNSKAVSGVSVIISHNMSAKKKKKPERPIFDSIRKPVAPPNQKIGTDKPEERIHPARRKIKHKRKDDLE